MFILTGLTLLLTSQMGLAAPSAPHANPAYKDFIAACTQVFSSETQETGKELCTCAAEESKHQKVTIARLKSETAEIRKDPKYQLKDRGVLASLHICTVQLMQALDLPHEHSK